MRNATDITIILDRSGSMETIKADTIGGFNQFIADQSNVPGDCTLTLVQFDSQNAQEIVYDAIPIAQVRPLTDATFRPRANTPLYDAVGQAITRTGERLSAMADEVRPDKVIFVIITDGYENASREWTQARVFEQIKHQTEVYKWEFVYLGANQDAMEVGARIGIAQANAMAYAAAPQQVQALYSAMSTNLADRRTGVTKSMAWTPEQRLQTAAKKS